MITIRIYEPDNEMFSIETKRADTSSIAVWLDAFLEGYHFPCDAKTFQGRIELDFKL